jgi:fumarate reductase flavoprotein subunit
MGGKIHAKAVVFCTGGFAGSKTRYGKDSLIERIRPDIANLPTSNPPSATGDGIVVGEQAGADLVDMFYVQVHPTGFIHPDKPRSEQHELVLATEALRGHGGLLFNQIGRRFVNEAGHRDWVSEAEMKNQKYGDIYVFMNSGSLTILKNQTQFN